MIQNVLKTLTAVFLNLYLQKLKYYKKKNKKNETKKVSTFCMVIFLFRIPRKSPEFGLFWVS